MNARSTLVLMYHGVATVPGHLDPANLFVTPSAFCRQLDALRTSGFSPVSEHAYLEALHGGAKLSSRSVLITFDDGYASMSEAARILAQQQFPAVCFVNPGRIGERSRDAVGDHPAYDLLPESGLRELGNFGVAIGAHGWDHTSLVRLPAAELSSQVADGRSLLAEIRGASVGSFAYPYGDHDRPARDAVRRAGFELAFAVHRGRGTFALPRVDINATDTPRTFRLKLSRFYPAARRASSVAPGWRRRVHQMLDGRENPKPGSGR